MNKFYCLVNWVTSQNYQTLPWHNQIIHAGRQEIAEIRDFADDGVLLAGFQLEFELVDRVDEVVPDVGDPVTRPAHDPLETLDRNSRFLNFDQPFWPLAEGFQNAYVERHR